MIRLQNLTKRFGDFYAVQDLSLEIPAGEIFCFLGPNGAGKTTTLKMLTGLVTPSGGTMSIAGLDVRSDPVAVKKIIGYIPDMPFLYEKLTTAEFFRFTGDLYNVPRRHVDQQMEEAFIMFDLAQHRHILINDLSHGMRQRLAYCCMFLHSPQALFIDEPLVGLDPHSIRMIKNLLLEKAKAGTAVFLTTHILALAEDIAHRIGIISAGRLVAIGTMAQLTKQSGVDGNLEEIFLSLTRPGHAASTSSS